jgi:P27 family predicted phage terminase small subunit
MGARGPAVGSTYGRKTGPKPKTAIVAVPTFLPTQADPPPAPPDTLGPLGQQIWLDVWEGMPATALDPQLDHLTITRLAEAAEDRAAARSAIVELGVVLEEPIVTPRGDVVGIRKVTNPALETVRKLDRTIDAASDRLGLSPAARARLGLTISRARLATADAASLMRGIRRP